MHKVIATMCLLAVAAWAGSATQPGAADDGGVEKMPPRVLRIYDVRDYLKSFNDYPLYPASPLAPQAPHAPMTRPGWEENSDVGPWPTGIGEVSQAENTSEQERMDDLIKLIETIVQPDCWVDTGGTETISALQGKLYVSATADHQTDVQKLLDEVTAGADRTVHVSAAWLALTEDQLSALRDPAAKGDNAIIRLDDQALQRATPVARAQLLCLDGQTVHIITGSHHGGIRLQIQPRLTASKNDVILDVQNSVADSQEFHTTARIPLGAEVVIGGITAKMSDKDQPTQLYLVIRVDAGQ